MARFCEGLEERATRPLTAEERARVETARRSWTITAAARAACVPAALAATIPLTLVAQLLPGGARDALTVTVVAIDLFFVVPAAVVWTGDAIRARRHLARDLHDGVAIELGDGTRSLVVLPWSGRVVARDGAPQDLQARVELGDAAPPPADAPTYGVPLESADVDGLRANGWVRRALVPGERDELRRIAAVLRRVPLRLPLLTTAFVLVTGQILANEHDLAGAILVAIGALSLVAGWGRWLRGRALGARLLADEAEGWIVRATAGELAGTEVLPASGAQWTQAGSPVGWRLRASRRR
jgi:hypothetical protein